MSMTDAEDLSKSEVFSKVTKLLIPWASAAAEQGCSMKDFEKGLLGGVLKACLPVVDQFLKSQGDGDLGKTIDEASCDDDVIRGSIRALTWAADEVRKRLQPGQLLVRLIDGQHSLWDDQNACQSDLDELSTIDILDLLHAAGYVGKAAKDLCQGVAAQEEFMKDRLLRILNGGVHSVIRGMKRMATRQGLSKDQRANVDAACHYFTVHAHRMKYDEYLAAGLPIATGIIEGACRHLVKDRLEHTGMRWSTEGAQGMLNLRSVRASNLWDDFQNHYFATSSLTA